MILTLFLFMMVMKPASTGKWGIDRFLVSLCSSVIPRYWSLDYAFRSYWCLKTSITHLIISNLLKEIPWKNHLSTLLNYKQKIDNFKQMKVGIFFWKCGTIVLKVTQITRIKYFHKLLSCFS